MDETFRCAIFTLGYGMIMQSILLCKLRFFNSGSGWLQLKNSGYIFVHTLNDVKRTKEVKFQPNNNIYFFWLDSLDFVVCIQIFVL